MRYHQNVTGKQLQTALDKAGLSQVAAAKAIGVTDRSMRRWVVAKSVPKVVELAVLYVCAQTEKAPK
jgi:hypothetical protein